MWLFAVKNKYVYKISLKDLHFIVKLISFLFNMHKSVCDAPAVFCSKPNGNKNHQRRLNECEIIIPPRKYRREAAKIYTRLVNWLLDFLKFKFPQL